MNKKKIVLEILFETFSDNPASIGVVIQDKKRDKRFKLLLEYSYFLSKRFGEIYLSEDQECCCLTIDSEKKGFSLMKLYWYVKLAFRVIGFRNASTILHRMRTLNEARPNEAHVYIWYIGVKQGSQRKGKGSTLLSEVIKINKNKTICLETTKESNFLFYEKLGFKKHTQIDLNYSFTLYRLKK